MCSCAVVVTAKSEKPAKAEKSKQVHPADTDKDGKISLAEFIALRKAQEKGLSDDKIKDVFELKDTNHDGFLSMDEMKEPLPIILD